MSEIEVDFPPLHKIINEAFFPLWNNQDRYLLLWGGRGSSKSDFTAKKLIKDCLAASYFRCILIRDTYATIKDSQYQTIKDIVSDWGLSSLFTFKENPLEIKCVNGNTFLARGCDDVDKIKSIKDPTTAWYEEGNDIAMDDFLTISSSIRTTKADFLQEIITFNPETEGKPEEHWLNQIFLKERNDKLIHDAIEIKLPSGIILRTPFTAHHSTYTDNRWCSPQFIAFLEQLRTIDPYYYDVYCKGIWGLKTGKNPWVNHYDPKKHESTLITINPNRTLKIAIDFNLEPFGVIFKHVWRDAAGHHDHTVDEAAIENGSIDKMIQYIGDNFTRYLTTCQLTGDFQGDQERINHPQRYSYFKQLQQGLKLSHTQLIIKPNPLHTANRSDVNYVMLHYPDFKINPKTCPNTCMDLLTVQSDDKGGIAKRNRKDLTQRADFLDCERYSINVWNKEWILQHQRSVGYQIKKAG